MGEHTLIGKFRAIISKINEKIKNKNENVDDLNDLDDDEILEKIGWIDPSTPDLLFNRPIMINGSFINWIDSKNFLITHQDKVKYRKVMKQAGKYNKVFGNGAIVCLGFVKTH